MSDLLSLLLQHQEPSKDPRETKAPVPEAPPAANATNPGSPASVPGSKEAPRPVAAPVLNEVRPISPGVASGQAVRREGAPAERGRAARSAPSAPQGVSTPRTRVDLDEARPHTLNELARAPLPEGFVALRRLCSFGPAGVWVPRLIVYPVLVLGLAVALAVAFSKGVFGRQGGGETNGALSSGRGGSGDNPSGAPWLEGGTGGTPTDAGFDRRVSGELRGDAPANGSGAGARPPGIPTGTSSSVRSPGGELGHVVRAITYSDNSEGIERAQSVVTELVSRGFPDARWVRIPQGKRHEVVVLVGRGASPRDPELVSLVQRLIVLGGFGKGQAKQRPFADAHIVRQPEADRDANGR